MWGKIKIRKTDMFLSQYLRKKYPYCQVGYSFGQECGGRLEVSHFHSRRKESVRFDEENIDVICWNHHRYFETHRTEYENWKLKKLGKRKYNLLAIRADQYKKLDDKLQLIILKEYEKKMFIEGLKNF